MTPVFPWLRNSILEHLDWISNTELKDARGASLTPTQFTEIWVEWLFSNEFVKLYGTPESPKGYLIARPIRMGWLFDTHLNYFEGLFSYDRSGEVVWIDSLWAPGFYANVLTFLRSTQKPYVAWSHKKRLFYQEINKLTGSVPKKEEIKDAHFRFI